jgi:hypothetical protein
MGFKGQEGPLKKTKMEDREVYEQTIAHAYLGQQAASNFACKSPRKP